MAKRATTKGRPRKKAPKPGDRVPLGLRVTSETKAALDEAAQRSGRSQSQEAELRLERSFHEQRLLYDALELAYGPQLAGLLLVMGDAMQMIVQHASLVGASWSDHPVVFESIEACAQTILAAFRPSSDAAPGLRESQLAALEDLGSPYANGRLDMLDRPRSELSPALHNKLAIERELLGPLLDRIKSDLARAVRDRNSSERDEEWTLVRKPRDEHGSQE